MSYWEGYWASKKDGGHRSNSEEFLKAEAEEKLFLLGRGDSLLDFGCGAAELLTYFAPNYQRSVGVDFSEAMLKEARARVEENGVNSELILADNDSVWTRVDGDFDHIINAGVLQYFTLEQAKEFLSNASRRLTPNGTIAFYDIIDPHIFFLFKIGQTGLRPRSVKTTLVNTVHYLIRSTARKIKGYPAHEMGTAHSPYSLSEYANAQGLKVQYVNSMFYEYRYHLLFTKDEA